MQLKATKTPEGNHCFSYNNVLILANLNVIDKNGHFYGNVLEEFFKNFSEEPYNFALNTYDNTLIVETTKQDVKILPAVTALRSEERRVGKEC